MGSQGSGESYANSHGSPGAPCLSTAGAVEPFTHRIAENQRPPSPCGFGETGPHDKMMAPMSTLKIKVIVGSSRANRFSEKPAQWIYGEAQKRADLDVELLDLRDYPLPFFEEAL